MPVSQLTNKQWYAIESNGPLILKRYTKREFDSDAAVGRKLIGPIEAPNILTARSKAREIRGERGYINVRG